MTYLVTGGAGFIGSHIVERLVKNRERVIVLDNLTTGERGNLKNVWRKIKFVRGDIRDLRLLRRAVRRVEIVLHQAAHRSVVRSIHNPAETNENNVAGTLNVLIAARDCGAHRVVFASSSSVYGGIGSGKNRETAPLNPQSPYAASKVAGEYYLKVFAKTFGVEGVGLRYFNVFGSRQNPNSEYAAVIPIFVKKLLHGASPVITGDGKQSRDFTYVENIVEANLRAARAPKSASGMLFNVGNGENTSINALFRLIRGMLGANKIPARYGPPQPGDVRKSFADITLAKRYLAYRPKFTMREGLQKTIAWYLDEYRHGRI